MRRLLLASLAAAALAVAAPPTLAQTSPPAAAVDPAAVKALDGMTAYLRTLKSFEVRTTTTADKAIDDQGGKITYSGTATYKVQRPNGFVVEVSTERQKRQFFYDGRQFTVYAPTKGFFAQASAPATINGTLDQIYGRYGIALPLADLFTWGVDDMPTNKLTQAALVGRDVVVGGVKTDHYIYAAGDLNWQLWISKGVQPLPRRVVITTVDDPAKPSYRADLTWNTQVTFPAGTFTFKPPANAKSITLAVIGE